MKLRTLTLVVACLLALTGSAFGQGRRATLQIDGDDSGFVLLGGKWANGTMPFYINVGSCAGPLGLDPTTTLNEVQFAMNGWVAQTNANIQPVFMGTTTRIGLVPDGQNTISCDTGASSSAFIGQSSGGWYQDAQGNYTDADAVLWLGSYPQYPFITRDMPCGSNLFILDVIIHEIGHMLGMAHSEFADATMYSGTGLCSTREETLYSDDIIGIETLYGLRTPTGTTPPPPPPPSGPALTVTAYKVKGLKKADLRWSGLASSYVDVWRNGVVWTVTPNDGAETDNLNTKGGGSTPVYQVCEQGTTTCTNAARGAY